MPYQQLPPADDDFVMPFGKHKGKKLKDVPASYLMWWIDAEGTVNTVRILKYVIANFDALEKEVEDKEPPPY